MIRAGRGSRHYSDVIKHSIIALGFTSLGDLTAIKNYDQLLAKAEEVYKDLSEAQMKNALNQVARFLFEIRKEDYVITYDSSSRTYSIGTIEGEH